MACEQTSSITNSVSSQDSDRHSFTVVLTGQRNVGKCSLFLRIIHDSFNDKVKKPIRNYCDKEITVEGQIVQMTLYFPEPGMAIHNQAMTRSYYHNAAVALLVYSADNVDSIKGLRDIVKDIDDNSNAELFLIRNKIDLGNVVTHEEALRKVDDYAHIVGTTLDTSAKTPTGLDHLLEEIGKVLLKKGNQSSRNTIRVHQPPPDSSPSRNNCACN